MSLLLLVGKYIFFIRLIFERMTLVPNFENISQLVSKLKWEHSYFTTDDQSVFKAALVVRYREMVSTGAPDGRPALIRDGSCKKATTFYFIFAYRQHRPGLPFKHCILLNSHSIYVPESYNSMSTVSVLVTGEQRVCNISNSLQTVDLEYVIFTPQHVTWF
jgi:hypothetical protein